MAEYLTVAEIYQMQHRLIDLFGGLHGVRDKGEVEAAVFRPQTGYYNSLEEEAAALMESLANNHGFLDGNKRIAFTAADVFLRRNAFYIEVEGAAGHEFISSSMDRREFRFPRILDWIQRHRKPLKR
jgi:death on curing protein